jgi:tetratricopeptide (TPR) repeat protein
LDVFHPNKFVTLTNIGQIYKIRGELQNALHMYKEAIAIQRQSGSSHRHFFDTRFHRLIHYQTRNYIKRLEVYQEALRIRRDAYGDNLNVASTLNSIGLVI